MNMCDGCKRKLRFTAEGLHEDPASWSGLLGCSSGRLLIEPVNKIWFERTLQWAMREQGFTAENVTELGSRVIATFEDCEGVRSVLEETEDVQFEVLS